MKDFLSKYLSPPFFNFSDRFNERYLGGVFTMKDVDVEYSQQKSTRNVIYHCFPDKKIYLLRI